MTFAAPSEPEDVARRLASEQAARADSDAAAAVLRRLETITADAFVDLPAAELARRVAERIVATMPVDGVLFALYEGDRTTILARRGEAIATIDDSSMFDSHARAQVVLRIGARELGAITVLRASGQQFVRDEVGVLHLAADRLAVAIDRAQSGDRERRARLDVERAHAQIERLYHLTTDLIQISDEAAIGDRVLREVLDATTALTGAVYERDELAAQLRRVAVVGDAKGGWQHCNPSTIALGQDGAAERATREASGIVMLHRDPQGGPDAPADGTRLAVPLLTADGAARGALVLGFDESDAVVEDEEWLRAVAGQGALALERRHHASERARMYASERAARAQADAQAQAARILDGIGEGIALLDRAGVVRIWNPTAASVTGIPTGSIIGKHIGEAWPQLAAMMDLVPLDVDPRSPSSRELLQLDVDGRQLWLAASAMTTRDGVVLAFRDVTETHVVERLRTELVATVSHELRTPITGVLGAVKTLLDDEVELDDAMRQQLLELIDGQAERLVAIVEDMLQVARLDNGTEQMRLEVFDLVEVAKEACSAHAHRGVDVQVEHAVGGVLVRGDRGRLLQVVDNLVDNAAAYGGGSPIEIIVACDPDHAALTVRDHGPGIPPGEHTRIFEKFYRLDPDMRRDGGGNGLGLYICRRLIEQMGGTIHADAEARGGAAFVVRLPLDEESAST